MKPEKKYRHKAQPPLLRIGQFQISQVEISNSERVKSENIDSKTSVRPNLRVLEIDPFQKFVDF